MAYTQRLVRKPGGTSPASLAHAVDNAASTHEILIIASVADCITLLLSSALSSTEGSGFFYKLDQLFCIASGSNSGSLYIPPSPNLPNVIRIVHGWQLLLSIACFLFLSYRCTHMCWISTGTGKSKVIFRWCIASTRFSSTCIISA